MALLKYFKRTEPKKSEKIGQTLSTLMPTSAIQSTLLDSKSPSVTETDGENDSATERCGNYQFFSPKKLPSMESLQLFDIL